MQDLNPPDTSDRSATSTSSAIDLPPAEKTTLPADAKSIARLVSDATIVGLGCNTRESHDLFRLVEDVTHHLIDEGFRAVALHENGRVGELFDRLLLGEDIDLDKAIEQAWGPVQTVEMKQALLRLRERNARNPSDPVRLIGIDRPRAILADYGEAVERLNRIDPRASELVREKLDGIVIAHDSGEHVLRAHGVHPGNPFVEIAREAREIAASLDPSEDRDEALNRLDMIVDYHSEAIGVGYDSKAVEEAAATTLIDYQRRTGRRVVVWEGSSHLAAHQGEALGFHFRQGLGDGYKAVLILFGSGRIPGAEIPHARADSLEAYLASAGGERMLDLRSPDAPAELVERAWPIRVISGSTVRIRREPQIFRTHAA